MAIIAKNSRSYFFQKFTPVRKWKLESRRIRAYNRCDKWPFIVVGPSGQTLYLSGEYQNPENWAAQKTENATVLMARPQEGGKHDLLGRICTYIDENINQKLTLRSVAEQFHVSVSTITQMFQRKTGETFHQYLTRQRMDAARELIRCGTALEDVGRMVGYTDHSTFYRAFRQTFGASPRDYRRELMTR